MILDRFRLDDKVASMASQFDVASRLAAISRISGGVAPGGIALIRVCEIAVTWALAVRISTFGWKNILMMPKPL